MNTIAAPAAPELAQLLDQYAHRHPEKAVVRLTGDRGAVERLPLLLGIPSGACPVAADQRPSPAWNTSLAVAYQLREEPSSLGEQLVEDCVLWPDRKTWWSWVERWPGLPQRVAELVRIKLGATASVVESDGAPSPATEDQINAALAQHPRAVWRRLRPTATQSFEVVLDPPERPTWQVFQDALRKPHAELWALVRDVATGQLRVFLRPDGTTISAAEVIDRWPGLAVRIIGELSRLVGAAAEAELGEW